MVVAATFLALVGFNYARGIKLLDGRRPDVTSSGPLGYNALGVALESAFPLAAALALVVLVDALVGDLGCPGGAPPGAALRAGLALPPVAHRPRLHDALRRRRRHLGHAPVPRARHTPLHAERRRREEGAALRDRADDESPSGRSRATGRRAGSRWGLLTAAYCAGLIAALALFLPRGQFFRDLLAALDLHAPTPSPAEALVQAPSRALVVRINILYAQSQDYIREVIQVLWG